jgi:hypothetical protein
MVMMPPGGAAMPAGSTMQLPAMAAYPASAAQAQAYAAQYHAAMMQRMAQVRGGGVPGFWGWCGVLGFWRWCVVRGFLRRRELWRCGLLYPVAALN